MKKPLPLTLGLGAALLLSVGAATAFGPADLSLRQVYGVLAYHLSGQSGPAPDPIVDRIVWQLRMPGVVLALLVGGGLSIIGVAMQALVRNPLAEPYILGISSGASAGASLFYLGFLPPFLSQALSMPLAAFLGGLLSITVVYLVARSGTTVSVARLLLAGVALSALMGAITAFVTYASPNPDKLRALLFWLQGSLTGIQWGQVALPAIACGLALLLMLALARPLDALLLGEEPAQSLGIPVERIKQLLIVLAAFVTGTLVATSGAIGFVGLIVPHAVRSLVGVTHRRVIPISFVAGALFLLWADVLARTLLPDQVLPVGAITALCGVPFFLYLLRRGHYHFG